MEVPAYVLHTPRLLVGQSPFVTCQSHVCHGKRSGEGISRRFTALASTTAAAVSALAFSRSVARGRDQQLIKRHCRTTDLETKLRATESKLRAALSTPRAEKELADLRERLRDATDELHKERNLNRNFEELKVELANAHDRLKMLADPDKAVASLEIKLKDADKKLRTALLAPRGEKQLLDLKEQLKEARTQLASGRGSQTIVAEHTTDESQRIVDLEAELKDAKAQAVAQEAVQQQLDQSKQQLVEMQAQAVAQEALQQQLDQSKQQLEELQAQAVAQEALQQQLDQSKQQLVELQAQTVVQEGVQQQLDQSKQQLVELQAKLEAAHAKQAESSTAEETRARSVENFMTKKLETAQASAAEFESVLKDIREKAGANLSTLQRSQADASKLRLELGLVADERNRLLTQSKDWQNKFQQAEQRASEAELRLGTLEGQLQESNVAPAETT